MRTMKDSLFNSAAKPGPAALDFGSDEEMSVARELVAGLSGAVEVPGVPASFVNLKTLLEKGGLGEEVSSWISRKADLPVTPRRLGTALSGTGILEGIGARTKLEPEKVLVHLSTVLPRVVHEVTPFGPDEPPEAVQFHLEGLGNLLRR
jgi:uncharacterized protein YidB (DUF937 family)